MPFAADRARPTLPLLPKYAQEAYVAALGTKELVWIETHKHVELVPGFLRRVVLPESSTAQPHEWPASSGGARVWSMQAE